MKKEELTLTSEYDDLQLSAAVFSPEETDAQPAHGTKTSPDAQPAPQGALPAETAPPKAIVQFSHGMAEHKERYYPFMEYLTERGYVTVINDHRGHGASVKDPRELGYFYDEAAEGIVEDLHQLTRHIKAEHPGLPVYLFGHSMGSLVVRKYIKKYDGEIDKLVVCGSPSKNPLVGLALALVKLQKSVKGDMHRSGFINDLAFKAYGKNIEKPISPFAWISASEDNVRAYEEDDLCGFVFTLNGFRNLFLLMKEVYEPADWRLQNKKLPIFFIAGSEDPVIVNEKKWLESQEFLRKLGYEDVKGKLYESFRHEILNEDGREQVYADVLNFFEVAAV